MSGRYDTVRLERTAENLAIVTFARPDRLNALTEQLLDETRFAINEAIATGARAILLTGEGRAFCSGADLATSGGVPDDLGAALEAHFNPLVETIFAAPVPIVAAVNGPAAGAGASIALACDIVVAARSAYFLQAFVNIGLIPDAGATWILPRLVGRAHALEMMMLGERISADQALAWGLIARVVDDEHIVSEGIALATRLAQGPTLALGLIRKLAREAETATITEALAGERNGQRDAGRSEDFRNGIMAFLAKQQPRFTGR